MQHRTVKQWTIALNNAALDILARRPDVTDPDAYRLQVEPCSQHGDRCACIVYGALLEHVLWPDTDPVRLAETLLQTLLPEDRGEPRRRRDPGRNEE